MNIVIDKPPVRTPLSYDDARNLLYKDLQDADQLKYFDGIWLLTDSPQGKSYTNLMDGVQGTLTSSPTNNAGYGWYGNGSSSYIDLGLNPKTAPKKYSLNDAHISVLVRTKYQYGGIEAGAWDGTNGVWISSQFTQGNLFTRVNTTTSDTYTGIDPRGWLYCERTNATTQTLYRDGVSQGSKTNNSGAIPNKNLYSLATSAAAGAALYSSGVTGLVTIGKSGVNTVVVSSIINKYLSRINYPIKTVYGYGDSFMNGYNASSQANSWYNLSCVYKHYDWHNEGKNGQAITSGGSQNSFDLTRIPTKTSYDAGMIVNWGLNDAYMIYYNSTRTFAQFQAAVDAFFAAAFAKGWSGSDIFWVTGWQVGANIYYTQAQLNTVFNEIRNKCNTYGARASNDFAPYDVDATDNVHPKNDAAYLNIFNQLKPQLPF